MPEDRVPSHRRAALEVERPGGLHLDLAAGPPGPPRRLWRPSSTWACSKARRPVIGCASSVGFSVSGSVRRLPGRPPGRRSGGLVTLRGRPVRGGWERNRCAPAETPGRPPAGAATVVPMTAHASGAARQLAHRVGAGAPAGRGAGAGPRGPVDQARGPRRPRRRRQQAAQAGVDGRRRAGRRGRHPGHPRRRAEQPRPADRCGRRPAGPAGGTGLSRHARRDPQRQRRPGRAVRRRDPLGRRRGLRRAGRDRGRRHRAAAGRRRPAGAAAAGRLQRRRRARLPRSRPGAARPAAGPAHRGRRARLRRHHGRAGGRARTGPGARGGRRGARRPGRTVAELATGRPRSPATAGQYLGR